MCSQNPSKNFAKIYQASYNYGIPGTLCITREYQIDKGNPDIAKEF